MNRFGNMCMSGSKRQWIWWFRFMNIYVPIIFPKPFFFFFLKLEEGEKMAMDQK